MPGKRGDSRRPADGSVRDLNSGLEANAAPNNPTGGAVPPCPARLLDITEGVHSQ
jgi:hypothetical protein